MEFEGKNYIVPVPGAYELLNSLECEEVYLSDESHLYDAAARQYTERKYRNLFRRYSSQEITAVAEFDVWWKLIHETDENTLEIAELREEYSQLTGEKHVIEPRSKQKDIADKLLEGSLLDGLPVAEGTDQVAEYLTEMNELIEQACEDISVRLFMGKMAIFEVVHVSDSELNDLEYNSSPAVHIFFRIREILAEKIITARAQVEQDTIDFGRDTAQAMAADRRRQESLAKKK